MGQIDMSQINNLVEKLATGLACKDVLVAAAVKHSAQNIEENVQEDLQS